MTKYKILEILRSNNEQFVSGELLSEKLNVSRTAVWKGIKSLKEKGYKIEGINNKGYRLIEDNSDNISEYEIKKNITGKELGKNIYYFETIDSTNSYAKKEMEKLEHGDVIIADEQLKGRGRMDKIFYSPKESGIYMTIVLKEDIFFDSIKLLSTAVSTGVCRAIEKIADFTPQLTWNDIQAEGKKVCGILTEYSLEGETGRVEHLIIGIGINVNNTEFPKEIKDKVTSLRIALGREINRKNLMSAVLNKLEKVIHNKKYITDRKNILNEFMDRTNLLGKNVEIKIMDKKIIGKVSGINDRGGLLIIKENGKKETVYNGELRGAEK